MLGREVIDPDGLEGDAGLTEGLGLLDMTTSMVAGKKLKEVAGVFNLGSGASRFTGYEMHNGVTTGPALEHPLAMLGDLPDGAISDDDQVMGTYVHGIFDEAAAASELLQWAGLRRQGQAVDYKAHRLAQLDRLADLVEECLDTDLLNRLLGLTRDHQG